MLPALDRLRRALSVARKDLALSYLRALAGEALEPSRALAFLVSDDALAAREDAATSGELPPSEAVALGAHLARARLEHAYRATRRAQLAFHGELLELEGERISVAAALDDLASSRIASRRVRLARALDQALPALLDRLLEGRARADGAVAQLAARVPLPRHPDAGPEGGSAKLAEQFLRDSEDLARESLGLALRQEQLEPGDGVTALWALLAPRFSGLFAREGRARRVALDWEPLGLRRLLTGHARVGLAHTGLGVHAHVLPAAVPHDVRIAPSAHQTGLAAELSWASGVGRAVALVHASPALPVALRQPTVASVARSLGALAVLRLAEPAFLRRQRGLSRKEAEQVARAAATFALLDARFAAAAVLARPLRAGEGALAQAGALGVRALTQPLPEALAAALVLRLSPGGPFRAQLHAPGLVWALRERFDEDWFANPRAAEPLRGATARAGDFSVEAFAEELGTTPEQGLRKLSELF
jgi:hypothetical protein